MVDSNISYSYVFCFFLGGAQNWTDLFCSFVEVYVQAFKRLARLALCIFLLQIYIVKHN